MPEQLQLAMIADVLPDGTGRYVVTPRKPQIEVGPSEAARILGVARSTLWYILDRPLGQKIIRWRWLTDKKGKRVFDSASLAEYRRIAADDGN